MKHLELVTSSGKHSINGNADYTSVEKLTVYSTPNVKCLQPLLVLC